MNAFTTLPRRSSGDATTAATLYGAAATQSAVFSDIALAEEFDADRVALRVALGDLAYEAAYQNGQGLAIRDAVDLALGTSG